MINSCQIVTVFASTSPILFIMMILYWIWAVTSYCTVHHHQPIYIIIRQIWCQSLIKINCKYKCLITLWLFDREGEWIFIAACNSWLCDCQSEILVIMYLMTYLSFWFASFECVVVEDKNNFIYTKLNMVFVINTI